MEIFLFSSFLSPGKLTEELGKFWWPNCLGKVVPLIQRLMFSLCVLLTGKLQVELAAGTWCSNSVFPWLLQTGEGLKARLSGEQPNNMQVTEAKELCLVS
ncbi:hypothetical protein E2I00_002742 [Balaenoptera physalus]|uniref:Uncharacterized protein n=1 Tax=Balaenoptera physalus TaxID=9770 RepID=A0A6A1QNI9_BALPH|nr:hypothetical protein E2I00_002742 [Balaenoptera physalus]